MKGELYFLEVSGSQQCFHIGELTELVAKNLRAFVNQRIALDYVPIFIGTREECSRAADKLDPILQTMRCGDELKRARVH